MARVRVSASRPMGPALPIVCAAGLALLGSSLAGCRPTMVGGLDSPEPGEQLRALNNLDARGALAPADRKALVRFLEHTDPAMRLLAITRLREATGTDLAYDYAGDPLAQGPAVRRWADWAEDPSRLDRLKAEARTPGKNDA